MIKDFESGPLKRHMLVKTDPFEHQLEAFKRYQIQDYGAFFCEMGTGKTKMVLDIIQNSTEAGTLVTAPNGLHLNWEYSEIPTHVISEGPFSYITFCWKGVPSTKRDKAAWACFLATPAKHKFFLINVEALRTKNGYSHAEKFLKHLETSHMVIDESTCIKNPKAAQTKACLKLGALASRRWILNGTPITQGPMDLYSQCKFLHKDSIPYNTYTAFKGTFAIEQVMTMGSRSFRKIVGYQQLERLTRELSPFSLRLEKEQCLDLPPKIFTERALELTAEQQRVYSEVQNLCLSEIAEGKVVSTTIALTKLIKLHQILTGFVKDDDGNIHQLENNRLTALLQIAETTKPLVIFCAYRENVAQIVAALEEKHGKGCCVEYHGGTSKEERTAAVKSFQDKKAQFFVGTSAAAKGLTLHAASTTVYYSNNYSLETRLQSQDRIHRIGQDKKCTYIDLVVPGSIDAAILTALQSKKELSEAVLDDLKQLIAL